MRMAMCHPERKDKARGLCARCATAAYSAAHREERRAYTAAHKEEAKIRAAAYYATHREERRAYNVAYHAAHKGENQAYHASYRTAHKEEIRIDHEKPGQRALRFLRSHPDCTSTRDEVAAIYAASIDLTTGLPGKVGTGTNDLALDHIHGGPVVGLIPAWLNHVCTRYLDGNLDIVLRHLERRRSQNARIDSVPKLC